MLKLRTKVLITIGLTWATLYAITYFGSQAWLANNNQQLVEHDASDQIQRINNALNENLTDMTAVANDWSDWEDINRYLLGKYPDFSNKYLNQEFFDNTQLDFAVIIDQKKNILLNRNSSKPHPSSTGDIIQNNNSISSQDFLNQISIDQNESGLINTPQGIALFISRAIPGNSKPHEKNGILILGRYLDKKLVTNISNLTNIDFALLPISLISSSSALNNIYQKALHNPKGIVENVNQQFSDVFFILNDFKNQPLALIQFKLSKTIYFNATKTLQYSLFTLLAIILVLVMVLWGFARQIIIKRLESLKNQVVDIMQLTDLSKRIHVKGDDDITIVTSKFNTLLDVIESSYTELEHRVQERTQDLQLVNQRLQREIDEHKITEKKLQTHKAHLNYMAHFDPLTSLPNRVLFNEILSKTIDQAKQNSHQLAILFLDLDRFKNINDTCGHSVGDKALRFLSNRLKKVLRENDTIARLGGDEFIILIPDITDAKYLTSIAEKLLSVFIDPIVFEDREFYLNASIGISVYPKDGVHLEELQKSADLAMYRAKKTGGGVYHFYTRDMEKWTYNQIQMESSLRKALINNEFQLFFQPIIRLPDRSIAKLESLLRWNHPEHGIIEPGHFIGLAEETGLIVPIGEFVIREACRIAKLWQSQGIEFGTLAVNLSPLQFRDSNFVNLVTDLLQKEDVAPSLLEFEITESAVMRSDFSSVEKLQQLHEYGIRFAIDDFGTGYSSISYLKQYPISFIKIDRSFVSGLPDQRDDVAITKSIIKLSHELNFKVVAEGVESEAQLAYLLDNECDMAQGYLFSKPISQQDMERQFISHHFQEHENNEQNRQT